MNQTEANKPVRNAIVNNKRTIGLVLGFTGICCCLMMLTLFVGNIVLDPLLQSVFGSYTSNLDIRGSFVDGKYTSPMGNFTCKFPFQQEIPGDTLMDLADQNRGRVVFYNDFGTLLSVDYIDNGPPANFEDPDERKSYLEGALTSLMQSLFLPVAPSSSIAHQEFLDNQAEVILYAIISVPQGHTLADAKTGERFDAMRGVFIFSESNFLYMLSSQSEVFDPKEQDSIDSLKTELQDFYDTCEFR